MAENDLKPLRNPKAAIKAAIKSGAISFIGHARQRAEERQVTELEMVKALATGFHDVSCDEFDARYQSWTYAIIGKTLDGKKIKVVAALDGPRLVVISVVRLKD